MQRGAGAFPVGREKCKGPETEVNSESEDQQRGQAGQEVRRERQVGASRSLYRSLAFILGITKSHWKVLSREEYDMLRFFKKKYSD